MAPIWRGDKVRVTTTYWGIPEGTIGWYCGGDEGEPGVQTGILRLRNGVRVRVPLLILDSAEDGVSEACTWKKDVPTDDGKRKVRTVDGAVSGDVTYELRGTSQRWFVVRLEAGEPPRRTVFYTNKRTAQRVMSALL